MRILKATAIIAATLLAVSCFKDNTILYREITMAEVINPNQVVTDAGLTYTIVEKAGEGSLEGLSRVLIYCNVLKQTGDKEFDIQLLDFLSPLKKDAVRTSTLTKPDDGLGNDPISVRSAWVSAGYLNLGLAVLILDSEKDHTINLEFDDTAPMDTLRFTVRHDDGVSDDLNIFAEDNVTGGAYATFPIANLLPEGVSTLPVKLTWVWDKEYVVKEGLKL
ncbi:MAG: hypothetical protein K6A64_03500 [Bacteroidales bacterium]|nr:hypothetical protein [Bacteroidales bacterium]